MAMQTKTNGTVTSCSHSGSAYSVTVDFPPPTGPKTFNCADDKQFYDDLLAAMNGGSKADVTWEDSNMKPSSVTTHKP